MAFSVRSPSQKLQLPFRADPMGEAVVPPDGFQSFDEFFTRKLVEGARPVDAREHVLVSPADGRVEDLGEITPEAELLVKGQTYRVGDLLSEPEAAEAYHEDLEALDAEVAALVAGIPAENRVLVTNHEVFGYFADRYGFEVAGAIIPGGSTIDGTSAGDLAELAELIIDEGVFAIFADVSASDQLAQTLADEVGGDIQVVELFTESLGDSDSDGATYIDMVRANATRIAEALAS